jgi:hypothetical protein
LILLPSPLLFGKVGEEWSNAILGFVLGKEMEKFSENLSVPCGVMKCERE